LIHTDEGDLDNRGYDYKSEIINLGSIGFEMATRYRFRPLIPFDPVSETKEDNLRNQILFKDILFYKYRPKGYCFLIQIVRPLWKFTSKLTIHEINLGAKVREFLQSPYLQGFDDTNIEKTLSTIIYYRNKTDKGYRWWDD